ncbi:hypothetical protein Slin15195_G051400 [Septoria linicola]|uniref:Transmembrane protein n=1 Tax=Septoria linicola TaxID=215465 RepID=A0A9Q9AW87_9PEZI|nr:hypothetical protein Slin14017_G130010 [Septoria linicola]USW51821.1 hypothetical protein Slin15195_G051400 [Septoria linicola]
MAFVSASAPSAFDEGQPDSRLLAKANAGYLVKMGASETHAMDISSGWDDSCEALIPMWDSQFAKVFAEKSPHGGHGMDADGWWDTDLPTYQNPNSAFGIPFIAIYNESGCEGSNCTRITDQLIGRVRLNTSYVQANCSEITLAQGASFHEITRTVAPTFNTIFNMTSNTTLATIQASREIHGLTVTSMCNLTSTDIELEIECRSQGCATTRARPTPNQKLSIDFFYNSTVGQTFLDNMIAAIDAPAYDGEDFLSSANKMQTASGSIDQALGAGDAATLVLQASRGLTQIINSYLSASQQALINSIDYDTMIAGVLGSNNATFTPVIMHGAPYAPQYIISLPWLIIDYVSCIVLLVCSIAAVVLRRRTLAPDVFGYVSSLTRDNPNIQLTDGGSVLPGMERARKLKNVRVQFAITKQEGGVGIVGLTVAEDGARKLQKGA